MRHCSSLRRRSVMAVAAAAMGGVLVASCTKHPTDEEQALIAKLESRVQLPQGSSELRCYKRYYTIVEGRQLEEVLGAVPKELANRNVLVGTYRDDGKPGIQWVNDPTEVPALYDGGCGDMRVFYVVGEPTQPVQAMCSFNIAGEIPVEGHRATSC